MSRGAQLGKDELIRADGLRIERTCKHGIGHPVRMTRTLRGDEAKWVWVHGCDGCCAEWKDPDAP